MTETVQENAREIGGLALLYVGYVEMSPDASYPSIEITGAGSMLLGAVALAVVGYAAAEKIHDLLPDDEGIYLVAFEASDEAGGEVWELSEDQFEDMHVAAGTLFQWPVSKRVYECREYRPEENVAVANWRESVAASELVGDTLVADAMEGIAELRREFEPEARKYRLLQRRLRGVVRKLDRRRLEDQQAILDDHTNPTLGDGERGATVADVLREEIPEDLRPESMEFDDRAAVEDDHGDGEPGEDFAGFDLLDDAEPLENGHSHESD